MSMQMPKAVRMPSVALALSVGCEWFGEVIEVGWCGGKGMVVVSHPVGDSCAQGSSV